MIYQNMGATKVEVHSGVAGTQSPAWEKGGFLEEVTPG